MRKYPFLFLFLLFFSFLIQNCQAGSSGSAVIAENAVIVTLTFSPAAPLTGEWVTFTINATYSNGTIVDHYSVNVTKDGAFFLQNFTPLTFTDVESISRTHTYRIYQFLDLASGETLFSTTPLDVMWLPTGGIDDVPSPPSAPVQATVLVLTRDWVSGPYVNVNSTLLNKKTNELRSETSNATGYAVYDRTPFGNYTVSTTLDGQLMERDIEVREDTTTTVEFTTTKGWEMIAFVLFLVVGGGAAFEMRRRSVNKFMKRR